MTVLQCLERYTLESRLAFEPFFLDGSSLSYDKKAPTSAVEQFSCVSAAVQF